MLVFTHPHTMTCSTQAAKHSVIGLDHVVVLSSSFLVLCLGIPGILRFMSGASFIVRLIDNQCIGLATCASVWHLTATGVCVCIISFSLEP